MVVVVVVSHMLEGDLPGAESEPKQNRGREKTVSVFFSVAPNTECGYFNVQC